MRFGERSIPRNVDPGAADGAVVVDDGVAEASQPRLDLLDDVTLAEAMPPPEAADSRATVALSSFILASCAASLWLATSSSRAS